MDHLFIVPRYDMALDLIGRENVREYRYIARTGTMNTGVSFRVLAQKDLHLLQGLRFSGFSALGCSLNNDQLYELKARVFH